MRSVKRALTGRKAMPAVPLVSVVVPHKDDSIRLARLLASVPEDARVEVIVVDDNSEDRWVTNLAECRMNVSIAPLPRGESGAGAARNHGISKARGKWLLFADSDDTFLDGAFGTIMEEAEQAGDSEIIFFYVESFDEEARGQADRHYEYNNMIDRFVRFGTSEELRCCWPAPWGKLIRRDVVVDNAVRFSCTPAANDVLFSLECGFVVEGIAVCCKPIYCVSRRPGSITQRDSVDDLRARLDVLIERNERLIDRDQLRWTQWGFKYYTNLARSEALGKAISKRYFGNLFHVIVEKVRRVCDSHIGW